MKPTQIILILSFLVVCPGWNMSLHPQKTSSLYIVGPSFSKHTYNPHNSFKEWHPGFGAELQRSFNKWQLGAHAYYMVKDSRDHNAWWMGFTTGYRFGSGKRFWCTPFVIVGGIKKEELYSGKFGFFVLPVLSVGYKGAALNFGYIPRVQNVTEPIFIVQVKLRIFSF